MSAPVSPRRLHAGVARVVVTPPIGIRMMGYTVQEDLSQGVERDLTATALVLDDGRQRAVMIAVDVLFIQDPHIDAVLERVALRLGISPEQVLINTSHTHLGPMFPGWQRDVAEQERMQHRYLEFLEEALAGVADAAARNLKSVRVGFGRGQAPIGINRRERIEDGRVIIGENPQGAVDHEVGVLRIDDLSGRTVATVLSAAAHTVSLGPRTKVLSPDYVGPAREIIEAATHAPSLFLLGAAGNVNPATGIGAGGEAQFDDVRRLGAMLGGETLKVWAQIRTHHRRGPRSILQSVAALSNWEYEPLPVESVSAFALASRTVTLDMAELPDRDFAQRQVAKYQHELAAAKQAGAGIGKLHVRQRLLAWSELVLRTIDHTEGRVTRKLRVWAMRLDDFGLVAVNGEPFAELGLEVKRRSPLPNTIFLGYSNGCLGYLPTPEAFAEGGMEVEESYRNYLLPCGFTPAWGPAVVQHSLELLEQLANKTST